MSKIQNVIIGALLFSLTLAVGYLGVQLMALQTAWEQSLQNRTAFQENSAEWSQDINTLKDTVAEQQAQIDGMANQWQIDLAKFETQVENTYLTKTPVLTMKDVVYSYNESSLTTVANTQALNAWIANNHFYLDDILNQALVISYDAKGALVEKVWPNSIFAQMGLKPGDRLVSYNGQIVNRSMDIKQKLLEPQNAKVVIARANQNLNLALSYENKDAPINNSIKVTDTDYQNQKAVKVVELDTTVPNLLQANDVILSVNGQVTPTAQTFYDTIKSTNTNNMTFAIVREGQTQDVDVALTNPGN